jgi:hypothetical protein
VQLKHAVRPSAGAKVPFSQVTWLVVEHEFPAWHVVQIDPPAEEVYVPSLQEKQADNPCTGAYLPVTQRVEPAKKNVSRTRCCATIEKVR